MARARAESAVPSAAGERSRREERGTRNKRKLGRGGLELCGVGARNGGGVGGSATNIWQRNARAKRKAGRGRSVGGDLSSTEGEGKLPGGALWR